MSEVFTIGANYRTAPLSLRESISMPTSSFPDRLLELKDACALPEAAIVSTCNRTEIYGLTPIKCLTCGEERQSCAREDGGCPAKTPQKVAQWLAGDYVDGIYRLNARRAVEHLFRVASGMESQIVGEPEITGQIKRAAFASRQAGLAGVVIGRLFDYSLSAAKDVRNKTDIGRHSVSYPALAVNIAAGIFLDFTEISVLFIGSGDMTAAGAPIFSDRGARRIVIAAKNFKRASQIADKLNAEVMTIAATRERLSEFDVVVCNSSSQVPIIGKGAVESAIAKRRRKPMMFADMAMPQDLEPEISCLPDVFVYTMEQFGQLAEKALSNRRKDLSKAETVVGTHVENFLRWLKQRARAPLLRDMHQESEALRQKEVAWAKNRLACGDSPEVVMESLSRRLAGKLLHAPSRIIADTDKLPRDDYPDPAKTP